MANSYTDNEVILAPNHLEYSPAVWKAQYGGGVRGLLPLWLPGLVNGILEGLRTLMKVILLS